MYGYLVVGLFNFVNYFAFFFVVYGLLSLWRKIRGTSVEKYDYEEKPSEYVKDKQMDRLWVARRSFLVMFCFLIIYTVSAYAIGFAAGLVVDDEHLLALYDAYVMSAVHFVILPGAALPICSYLVVRSMEKKLSRQWEQTLGEAV